MTFDAFWDIVHWLLLPAISALAWWVLRIDTTAQDAIRTSELRLSEAVVRAERSHTKEITGLSAQFAAFQLDVVRSYARTDQLERALDRISARLEKIEQKIEELRGFQLHG